MALKGAPPLRLGPFPYTLLPDVLFPDVLILWAGFAGQGLLGRMH